MIQPDQIKKVVNLIVKHINPEKIILFGSYAYGKPNKGSDLDLLIIKEMNIPRYKRGREVRKYLRGLAIPMDLIVYTNHEIEKWQNVDEAFITQVIKKGKILYG
ncbi:hypothetical protein ES705_18723 [subsurface metagenome]